MVDKEIKTHLLNEFERHQEEMRPADDQAEGQPDESVANNEKLDYLKAHETQSRVRDILETHAAARTAAETGGAKEFRSHDDADDTYREEPSYMNKENLMGEYGLAKAWGGAADKNADEALMNSSPNEASYFGNLNDSGHAASEHDYVEKEVKRSNLVQLFLDEMAADKFIATHLWGAIQEVEVGMDTSFDQTMFHNMSKLDLSTSFAKKRAITARQTEKIKKLTPFETYIALIKGYCAIVILFLPSAFLSGGWGMSTIILFTVAFLTTVCTLKLVESGQHLKIYSYSLLAEKALGKKGKVFLDITVMLTQYSFTVSHILFIVKSLKSTFDVALGVSTNPWLYASVMICILTPLAWVRNIATFSFSFMIGNIMILLTFIIVCIFCITVIAEQDGLGPDLQVFNHDSWLNTVGLCIYSFEGIGLVMPIMQSCDSPQRFKSLLMWAIITLTGFFFVFGQLCYLTYGSNFNEPIITEMLPANNIIVIIMKIGFCVNLVCTYPIMIFPANQIIEGWVFRCMKKKSTARTWLKNFSRFLVCISAAYIAVQVADKIDKFLGLLGALLCAPLALTMPALIHLKLLAKTTRQKMIDIILVLISLVTLTFCTWQSLANWSKPSSGH